MIYPWCKLYFTECLLCISMDRCFLSGSGTMIYVILNFKKWFVFLNEPWLDDLKCTSQFLERRMLQPLNPPVKTAYPLMISLFSPLMKYSCSGVMIHSEFFWPVRGSASTTSVQRFMFTVPWGKVLGWRGYEKNKHIRLKKLCLDVIKQRTSLQLCADSEVILSRTMNEVRCGQNLKRDAWVIGSILN